MNNDGKILTVFLVVIVILLISITSISFFFFLKEVETRKGLEVTVEQMREGEAVLQKEIKESKKEVYVLQEKNKDSNERIESLMQDVDLEKGLREESKKAYQELEETIAVSKKAAAAVQQKLTEDLDAANQKIATLQQELTSTLKRNKELDEGQTSLQDIVLRLRNQLEDSGITPDMMGTEGLSGVNSQQETGKNDKAFVETQLLVSGPQAQGETQAVQSQSKEDDQKVNLEPIIVSPKDTHGKILSIDKEAEFLIVGLGQNEKLKEGSLLSIYRDSSYLGDVKITRVLPEMSAADFVPPLDASKVLPTDQVRIKQ